MSSAPTRLLARSCCVALLLSASLAAAEGAPPELVWGSVEAGFYKSTQDSYTWGEYTGIKDDAWYVLGNFDIEGRAPWDSGETWNFRAQGLNLGLPSRWVRVEGGFQGLVDAWVEWNQIPHYVDDTGEWAFNGRGSDLLTLPSNWVGAPSTSGFTALGSSLDSLNVSLQRNILSAGADVVLPRGFELGSEYEWERRQGRRIRGSVIGNSGGNPRAVLVPDHIDWTTHESDTALRYADERLQLEVGYEFSKFDDQDDSLTWQNPFSAISGWAPSAGFPSGYGRRALEPDNTFHQVRASGGYDLPWWHTRVAANAAFGWYRQDDDFYSYSVNPALEATVTRPVPRGDADAKIDATNLGLRVTSRPLDRLRVTTTYRFVDRDNDTPRDTYVYIPGDSAPQNPSLASDRARVNLPNSYRVHEGRLELGYEVYERTEVTAGYERQHEERSWTETDQMDDDIFRAGIHTRALRWADFRVDGVYWKRDAGDYFYQAPFVWGFSSEYVATVPDDERFENAPALRKYNLTSRDRSAIDARLTLLPLESLNVGANVGWLRDDYGGSELGLRERKGLHWGLDASWSPCESLTGYAWYQHERYESDVRGRQWSSTEEVYDSQFDWTSSDQDDVDTVGVGVEWLGFDDRLRLRSDYVFSWAKERIDTQTGPGLSSALPLPDARTAMHDVSFTAEVRILENLRARFGYLFEHVNQKDWAYDDVGVDTVSQVLGLGQTPPDYDAHLFAFSLEYDFSLPR